MNRAVRASRTLALWCPDWPVVAAIHDGQATSGGPAAVFRANRVVACTAEARADGIRRGMRRREAQARSPDVTVLADDAARDARAFEVVVAAVERFTPLVEIVRPGWCQLATRGPSRYFGGGDDALAGRLVAAVADAGFDARAGVADGPFAAMLAARTATAELPMRVEALGCTAVFLASQPVTVLLSATPHRDPALIDLVSLFGRLGLQTLGAVAALPATDVLARFGPLGVWVHRLAADLDPRSPNVRTPPPELPVTAEFDPPCDRVDQAAFVARGLAEELHDRLTRLGLACTRIAIEGVFDDGTTCTRLWRHERAGAAGGLTPTGLADRVRWQLDGWITARRSTRSLHSLHSLVAGASAIGAGRDWAGEGRDWAGEGRDWAGEGRRAGTGLTIVRLVPDEVLPDEGRQLGLWGAASATDERAARAFARVQGLLGPDAVATPVPVGGRRPAELITLVTWGDLRERPDGAEKPWPGRIPSPLPSLVHELAIPATINDADGHAVVVSGRGVVSSVPVTIKPAGEASRAITGWAGPWPLDERWWDVDGHRRQARFQVLTESGTAYLAVLEGGSWWIEATYD